MVKSVKVEFKMVNDNALFMKVQFEITESEKLRFERQFWTMFEKFELKRYENFVF
jgi:hypothetical protein